MAGTIKTNAVQLGDSATATQNFVWQTNVDGSAKLARGNVGATTQDILMVDAAGKVILSGGLDLVSVANSDYVEGTWTPVWTSTGTQPAIGNGSIVGTWTRIGRVITATVRIAIGSTTVLGTGNYNFQLPVVSVGTGMATLFAVKQGSAYYGLVGPIEPAVSFTGSLSSSGGAGQSLGATWPATWANNDAFTLQVSYIG